MAVAVAGITVAIIIIIAFFTTWFQQPATYTTGGMPGIFNSGMSDMMVYDMGFETTAVDSIKRTSGTAEISTDQKIIKTGYLTIVVLSVEESANALEDVAAKYNGDVLTRSINSYNDEISGYVTLRVEESQFETAILEIKALAEVVESENVDAEDVTQEVIDIEARLSNARAEEESYLAVLDSATTVEDILNVHNYLSNVREEIERLQAQLDYYAAKTNYSMITVSMSEDVSVSFEAGDFRPWQEIKNAVQSVIRLSQSALVALIYIVIIGGAIIVPLGILYFIVQAIIQKLNHKK